METITLNDGTVITNAVTILAYVGLWVHLLSGYTLEDAYRLFSDPENTARIVTDKFEPSKPDEQITYEGYTGLFCIREEDDGQIVIGLRGGDAGA